MLLCRPGAGSVGLGRRLTELGARVVARPTIVLQPPADAQPAREAMQRLGEYDWLVFTSPNGVGFFLERAEQAGIEPSSVRSRIAAIGPSTARALAAAGLNAGLTAEESRSEGLAAALSRQVGKGQRVLLVRPEQARQVIPDSLRRLGVKLDAVAFYRNLPAPDLDQTALEVCRGAFDLAVFTSPSTFRRLLGSPMRRDEVRAALDRLRIVAIGEVTAGAIRGAGLRVAAVAARPTDDGIAEALVRCVTIGPL